jgi:predicted aspartyl protease
MGKVLVQAKIENLEDIFRASKGEMPFEKVRRVEVQDALVDTGGSTLLVPKKLISQLGLIQFKTRPARGLGGTINMPVFSAVRLTVQGRDCTLDVAEIGDDFPVLIGQIPLEMMDWVVDFKGQKLIGNPEHGGEQIIEVF